MRLHFTGSLALTVTETKTATFLGKGAPHVTPPSHQRYRGTETGLAVKRSIVCVTL